MYSFNIKVYDRNELIAENDESGNLVFSCHSSYGATPRYFDYGTMIISKRNILDYLESRCPQRNRVDLNRILRELGLGKYDPVRIVEKTHGIMYPLDTVSIDITNIVGERKWDF